ncbi:unnamed protein product [Caenorhabditis bovis]|uniref:Uncharacterized protein n=1 Tax=Caenorhabditis bovis TaxID=2654633 RepID=A0A8S1F521_9PELO|nr:unnamed protein product [Caenorhabditis bovis]
MDDLIQGVVVTVKALILVVVSIVKSCLPNGVLPRKSVRGQNVLITGSGSGLGRLMAYEGRNQSKMCKQKINIGNFQFGNLGANLILWDINENGNQETLEHLKAHGVEVSVVAGPTIDKNLLVEHFFVV